MAFSAAEPVTGPPSLSTHLEMVHIATTIS